MVIPKKYTGPLFNKGEWVKCVNNDKIVFYINGNEWNDKAHKRLVLNKYYKILRYDDNLDRIKIVVETPKEVIGEDWFYPERFCSIKQERKIKLNKILQNKLSPKFYI